MLETKRLLLRSWEAADYKDLYLYAKDPDIGPITGWPAHQNEEESLQCIKNVLNGKECYAICLKEDNRAIGAIEIKLYGHTARAEHENECEIGYWIGKPFWGNGYMPEAVKEILRHAFEELNMNIVWCCYYDGNTKSKRVQEKCGFQYFSTDEVEVPLLHEKRISHCNRITREQWHYKQNKEE